MKKIPVIFFMAFGMGAHAQIQFQDITWQEALQRARSGNKLIFLDAHTSWCEECKILAKYIFTDLEVSNFYNPNFINIRLDMEEYPGLELAEKYNVAVYPTLLFVDSEGNVVHRGCGAVGAAEFLELGKDALNQEVNFQTYKKKFKSGDRSKELVMAYLSLLEFSCQDFDRVVREYLSGLPDEKLAEETPFSVIEAYQWDIYSREFQVLIRRKGEFEEVLGKERVNRKILDTYWAQYQEVYEAEELHFFGMRALLHSIDNVSFSGSDTLSEMMNVHYYELIEDWKMYAVSAIKLVELMQIDDPGQLNELAWKFYLFVDDKEHVKVARDWAKSAVESLPEPSTIDTYASLLYKLGDKKNAIELEEKALEMALESGDDTSHFEHQLRKFKEP